MRARATRGGEWRAAAMHNSSAADDGFLASTNDVRCACNSNNSGAQRQPRVDSQPNLSPLQHFSDNNDNNDLTRAYHQSMTIDSNTSDRALHDRVPSLAAATAAASVDATRHDDAAAAVAHADQELDREVSRFLESEFFASQHDDSAASRPTLHSAFLKEELLFMDISESIDMPDLEYDSAMTSTNQTIDTSSSSNTSGDIYASVGFTVDNNNDATTALPRLAPAPIAESTPVQSRPSLRVVIPASALAMAPQPPPPAFAPSHPPTAASSASLSDLLPPPSQITGRKRVKYELEYLRQQVQQFETKLAQLKQNSGNAPPPTALSLSNNPVVPFAEAESPTQTELWKRIAVHQQVQKQQSERENAKLRVMLESQLKIAQSLSRVLHKRQDLSWLDSPRIDESAKRHCTTAGALSDNNDANARVFDQLAVQVETMYAQLDTVLAESGVSAAPAQETQSGDVRTDADGRVFLEVVDVAAVPFDVQTTSVAVWKLLCSPHMAVCDVVYQAIDAKDDTVRGVFTVTLRMRQQATTIRMLLVAKRIVEAHRVVHLWCARGETDGGLFGKERVQVRESAWSVVEAAPSSAADDCTSRGESSDLGNTNEPLTIMQSVVRMTPLLNKNSSDSVGVFTEVCLSAFRQNITTMRQMIEDMVLEGAAA